MSFKVLKYFSSGKIIFFLFACLWVTRSQTGKNDVFSGILTHTTVDFSHKKMLVRDWNLAYLEVNGTYK